MNTIYVLYAQLARLMDINVEFNLFKLNKTYNTIFPEVNIAIVSKKIN